MEWFRPNHLAQPVSEPATTIYSSRIAAIDVEQTPRKAAYVTLSFKSEAVTTSDILGQNQLNITQIVNNLKHLLLVLSSNQVN